MSASGIKKIAKTALSLGLAAGLFFGGGFGAETRTSHAISSASQYLQMKAANAAPVELPPGIAHCSDPAIIEAYIRWHEGGYLEGISANIVNAPPAKAGGFGLRL